MSLNGYSTLKARKPMEMGYWLLFYKFQALKNVKGLLLHLFI